MIIKIQIEELNFCDVIMKAMPILKRKAIRDNSAASKIVSIITNLPSEIVDTVLAAVPQKDKHEIMALLLRENKAQIRNNISEALVKNKIHASLTDIDIDNDLGLTITVDDLNYASLFKSYLPLLEGDIIHENPFATFLAALIRLPHLLLHKQLAKIPQVKKDQTAAYLVTKSKNLILAKLESMFSYHGIRIRFKDLCVTA